MPRKLSPVVLHPLSFSEAVTLELFAVALTLVERICSVYRIWFLAEGAKSDDQTQRTESRILIIENLAAIA